MITDIDIHRAAQELVERHGDSATFVAQERITTASQDNDQSGLNLARRVLSALETLLERRRQ
jgi:hypothetical protein